MRETRSVALTGATGYLGSILSAAFADAGWRVVPLVRTGVRPGAGRAYQLGTAVPEGLLTDIDVLVHCAYDMTLRSRAEVWDVNVAGTERLLAAASSARVGRVIVVSSIAAFEGTRQLYGQAKLAIEESARRHGAIVVRPGLVFGPNPGGMVGALRQTLALPLVPLLAGSSHQYLIHQADLALAILLLGSSVEPLPAPIVVAGSEPVSMADILRNLGASVRRQPLLVPAPWQLVYLLLRVGEALGLRLPFKADSLWGLAHPPPPPAAGPLLALGILPRRFTIDNLAKEERREEAREAA